MLCKTVHLSSLLPSTHATIRGSTFCPRWICFRLTGLLIRGRINTQKLLNTVPFFVLLLLLLFERSEFLIYTWASQYRLPWKKNRLRACLRLNLIFVWDHLILDCRCRQTTTEQQNTHTTHTADHTGKNSSTHRSHSRHTALTQRGAHRQRAQRATTVASGERAWRVCAR